MKRVLLAIIFITNAFGHSGHNIVKKKESKSLSYGIFGDFIFEKQDLYKEGIPFSYGYESHNKDKELQVEHYGAFLDANYDEYNFALEVNKHNGAKNDLDNLLEKVYLKYENKDFFVKVGRDINSISFINEKEWGYGFVKMPLYLDSFFDKSLYSDGLFFKYSFNDLDIYADYTKHVYTNKTRKNIKLSYKFKNTNFISYYQVADSPKDKKNFISKQSDGHSHSHAISSCDTLEKDEVCIQEDKNIFGIGIKSEFDKFEIMGEYTFVKKDGNINNQFYKSKINSDINSIYTQFMSKNEKFNYGLRTEFFWYKNKLKGMGASEIYKQLPKKKNKTNYLHTISFSYKINKYNKIYLENLFSNDDFSSRLFYKLTIYK